MANDYRDAQREAKEAASRARALRPWYRKKHYIVLMGIGVLFILGMLSSLGGDADSGSTSTPQSTSSSNETPSSTQRATAATTPAGIGDGTHRVGADIAPGRYRTTPGTSCYYARLQGFSGALGDITSNENARGKSAIVDIQAGDAGFQSRGCGRWVALAGAATSSPTAPIGDGTWLVGTDVAAGTWHTDGGSGCYYARLRDFTGDLNAIIANDNARGAAIVTIAATDVGFTTRNCGTWSP